MNEFYAKIQAEHVSPLIVTKLPEKGGGGHKDRKILLKNIYFPIIP